MSETKLCVSHMSSRYWSQLHVKCKCAIDFLVHSSEWYV